MPHQAPFRVSTLRNRSLRRWGVVGVVGLAVALAALGPRAEARPTAQSSQDAQIAKFVRLLMEQRHLTRRAIDDEIAQRGLDKFLEMLDPWKRYFYQSDIDEFNAQRTEIDNWFRRGDIGYAYTIFTRFLTRVEERSSTALSLIEAGHDFTIDEEMIGDRDQVTYPKTPEEAYERWRKRIKYELLTQVADDVDLEEAKEKLRKRYQSLLKRWDQTSNDDLLELYVTAITSGFDPHSSYMSKETLEDFDISMRLELDGVGASLRSEDGYTEVQEVIPGGAADRHGKMKKGDVIIGVGQGTDGPIEDIVDMRLRDVVKLIRGKRGTIVRLQVKPVDNPKDIEDYVITRDRIELKSQEARSTVIEWGEKPNGEPYRIGVVDLPSFYMDMRGAKLGLPNYKSTTRDVRRLLEGFQEEGPGVDAVVVDLRFNGGGSLDEAVNMTGLFIDQGPVVQVKGPDGQIAARDDESPGMVWAGPLVVLTNKFSASASEIFAGAIQDYGRGIVVGDEATHGKGTVQVLQNIGDMIFRIGNNQPNLGALKMTIQQFYRPAGDSTQNRGVLADVVIPSLTDHLKGVSEAEMDYALAFSHVRPLPFDRLGMSDTSMADELQHLSDERVAQSEDFSEDLRRITLYEEQRDKGTVTLNLERYLAEREQLEAEKDQQEEVNEELSDADRPVFDMEDHYNQEAASIVIDYLKLLRENKLAVVR